MAGGPTLRDRLGGGTDMLAGDDELIGMPVDANLLRAIGELDVTELRVPPAVRVHIVTSTPRPDCDEWHRRLVAGGGRGTCSDGLWAAASCSLTHGRT